MNAMLRPGWSRLAHRPASRRPNDRLNSGRRRVWAMSIGPDRPLGREPDHDRQERAARSSAGGPGRGSRGCRRPRGRLSPAMMPPISMAASASITPRSAAPRGRLGRRRAPPSQTRSTGASPGAPPPATSDSRPGRSAGSGEPRRGDPDPGRPRPRGFGRRRRPPPGRTGSRRTQLGEGLLRRERRHAVGPLGGHRLEGVGDVQDPRELRDLVADEAGPDSPSRCTTRGGGG